MCIRDSFYSDYICDLQDGRVAKFGTVEEVMTKETLSELYQVDFKIMTIAGRPLSEASEFSVLLSKKRPAWRPSWPVAPT